MSDVNYDINLFNHGQILPDDNICFVQKDGFHNVLSPQQFASLTEMTERNKQLDIAFEAKRVKTVQGDISETHLGKALNLMNRYWTR